MKTVQARCAKTAEKKDVVVANVNCTAASNANIQAEEAVVNEIASIDNAKKMACSTDAAVINMAKAERKKKNARS